METKVRIGDRWIGDGEPCFIIAEAGSNHNGSLDIALRLAETAARCGADAVKFQTFKASSLYSPLAGSIDEDRVRAPIYDALADLEMPLNWIPILARRCSELGMLFLCTPFDEESADVLDPHVMAFKIASYELNHYPLLRHIASKGKPIILSSGAAYLEEVTGAVSVLQAAGHRELILLQCTAEYPAPLTALNLRTIITMRDAFSVPTGLSDHSRDPVLAPVTAVALGASLIEKHLTLSNDLPGPDHEFAIEPKEFTSMVQSIRKVEQMLGNGIKEPHEVEQKRRAFGYRAIFATADIGPGDVFTKSNTRILRQGRFGYGLHPKHYDRLLGAKAARAIKAGCPITEEDYVVHNEDITNGGS